MGSWTTHVVLALVAASSLALPRPELVYDIPNVGEGRRAQYFVLHDDGTFKYGYDTSDFIYEQAVAEAPGRVVGEFGYKDPQGTDVRLQYTADDRGFVPSGTHIPVAPEASIDTTLSETPVQEVPAAYSIPESAPEAGSEPAAAADAPAAAAAEPEVPIVAVRSSPVTADDATVEAEEDSNTEVDATQSETVAASPVVAYSGDASPVDASYSFSYDSDHSSRSEKADSSLNVKGSYSFNHPDLGRRLTVNYFAGSDTGFVAEGDHLPKAPEVTASEPVKPVSSVITKAALSPEAPSAPADSSDNVASSAPATLSVPAAPLSSEESTDAAEAPVEVNTAVDTRKDASYSFSYNADDSTRVESADANLNVEGSFSFVPKGESHQYVVTYVAGPNTGFVAQGDHLPVPVVAPVITEIPQISEVATPLTYNTPETAEQTIVAGDPVPLTLNLRSKSIPDSVYVYSADASPIDPAYSFTYEADDSSRSESADSNLNIKGSYSFVPPGESHRFSISYIAGPETGFVATGDHLPAVPEDTLVHVEAAAAPVVYSAPVSEDVVANVPEAVEYEGVVLPVDHSSQVVGNVLLKQYNVAGDKYGYVFTALDV